jgi:hypothetical protein
MEKKKKIILNFVKGLALQTLSSHLQRQKGGKYHFNHKNNNSTSAKQQHQHKTTTIGFGPKGT